MRIVVLDAKTIGDVPWKRLQDFGSVQMYQTTSPKQTPIRIKDADIVITNKVVIDKDAFERAPKLKLICVAATGMNNIDLQEAKRRGIVVKNVSGYSTPSVVQHTFAMALYLLEHLRFYDDFVKKGEWSESGLFTSLDRPFFEMQGKRWGIVGLGAIGKEVAKVARCFGCEVVYHSTSGKNLDAPCPHLPLQELMSTSHIISIHAPLNERTKNLIGKKELSLMREGAVLLNLGRGGIVDENALAQILDTKNIYVGLDVTAREPIAKDSPLLRIENEDRLLITPHIAWTSIEARERLFQGIVANIEEFLHA